MEISADLIRKLEEAEQSIVPADLREKGWVYRDMPGKCTYECWDLFLSIMGEGNYQIVIASQGPDWKRGQFFLSPQAIENLKNYASNSQDRRQESACIVYPNSPRCPSSPHAREGHPTVQG